MNPSSYTFRQLSAVDGRIVEIKFRPLNCVRSVNLASFLHVRNQLVILEIFCQNDKITRRE